VEVNIDDEDNDSCWKIDIINNLNIWEIHNNTDLFDNNFYTIKESIDAKKKIVIYWSNWIILIDWDHIETINNLWIWNLTYLSNEWYNWYISWDNWIIRIIDDTRSEKENQLLFNTWNLGIWKIHKIASDGYILWSEGIVQLDLNWIVLHKQITRELNIWYITRYNHTEWIIEWSKWIARYSKEWELIYNKEFVWIWAITNMTYNNNRTRIIEWVDGIIIFDDMVWNIIDTCNFRDIIWDDLLWTNHSQLAFFRKFWVTRWNRCWTKGCISIDYETWKIINTLNFNEVWIWEVYDYSGDFIIWTQWVAKIHSLDNVEVIGSWNWELNIFSYNEYFHVFPHNSSVNIDNPDEALFKIRKYPLEIYDEPKKETMMGKMKKLFF
jgi:hypothetical protein